MNAALANPDLLLARRAAAGHPDAWDEIIRQYGRRIFNIAFQFAADPAEAEDLTQEVFLKLYQNLRSYRGDVPLVGWTLRLSRNLCIDHFRHSRGENRLSRLPEVMLERVASSSDPHAEALRRQELDQIYRALEEMPEDLAEILVLRDLQELSYDEVATALDLPMGTVKSRLNRARHELTQIVGRQVVTTRPLAPAAGRKP